MSRALKRLLLQTTGIASLLMACALLGTALAYTSKLLGFMSLLCLVAGIWVVLWTTRPQPSQAKAIKPFDSQFFSPAAVKLSESFGEKLLWQSRAHPITLWPLAIGFIALTGFSIAIGSLLSVKAVLLLWIGGVAFIAIRIVIWHRTLVCVTDRRLMGISGVLETSHLSIPHEACPNKRAIVDPLGENLARLRIISAPYGVLEIRSPGADDGRVIRITHVPHVEALSRLLRSR